MTTSQSITDLLQAWEHGDQEALEELMSVVLAELHHIAKNYLRHERPNHTLQTGALINEACIKLIGQNRIKWQNRKHFYAIAAQCMRRVLIDYAKMRKRAKRGMEAQQLSLSDLNISEEKSEELLALDAALKKLAERDKRKSQVVELRYFGGHSVKEVADILDISEITVVRDWRLARSWLRRELDTN